MPELKTIIVQQAERLDLLLVSVWDHLEHDQIMQMIHQRRITVNDIPARNSGQQLYAGDHVTVVLPVPEAGQPSALPLSLKVAFEDAHFLVVEKPAGLALKPSSRSSRSSLVQSLLHERADLANVGGVGHAGLITTLEDEVSGLVLFAKDETVYRSLRRERKRQRLDTIYTGMVEGHIRGEGVISEPIGNARHERVRQQVSREGRPAVTSYRVQRHFKDEDKDYTLLLLTPETSRRHQMRVHLAWYGFPLVGDRLYGSRYQNLVFDRIFLHLGVIEFPNVAGDERIHVESPLPPALQSVLTYLLGPLR